MSGNMGDGGLALISVLQERFGVNGPRTGVEVGVYRGSTSARLLRNFPLLKLLMVDPWATYAPEHSYRKSGDGCAKFTPDQQQGNLDAAMMATEFAFGRRTIIREASTDYAATLAADRLFDFVFIDGDHTHEAVKDDIAAWWPHVRVGGIIAGDDYGHPRDRSGVWGVSRAVHEFGQRFHTPVKVNKPIWSIAKDRPRSSRR
jgi:hypothetical protein